MRAALPTLESLLFRSSVAALTAAVFYYLLHSAGTGQFYVSADLPLWFLAMGVLVLPIALGSAALARLLLLRPVRISPAPMLVAAPITCAASIFVFRWYMSELAPAVNWQSGWPLPAVASVVAIALEARAFWRLTAANRTVGA